MINWFLKGGPLMWPLLACSVAALTLILERVIFWVQFHRRRRPQVAAEMLRLCREGRLEQAHALGRRSGDPVARVLSLGLEHRGGRMQDAFQFAAAEAVTEAHHFLPALQTIITVSPMLGILGTVMGIVQAFGFLGVKVIQDPEVVASGIAVALITTEAGLFIAIPALIFYNYFHSRADRLVNELELACTELEMILGAPEQGSAAERIERVHL